METKTYSFGIGVKKALVAIVLFGLPLLVEILPEQWMNLTIGALLTLAVNYIKFNYNNLK
jgi:hypothetical protein